MLLGKGAAVVKNSIIAAVERGQSRASTAALGWNLLLFLLSLLATNRMSPGRNVRPLYCIVLSTKEGSYFTVGHVSVSINIYHIIKTVVKTINHSCIIGCLLVLLLFTIRQYNRKSKWGGGSLVLYASTPVCCYSHACWMIGDDDVVQHSATPASFFLSNQRTHIYISSQIGFGYIQHSSSINTCTTTCRSSIIILYSNDNSNEKL